MAVLMSSGEVVKVVSDKAASFNVLNAIDGELHVSVFKDFNEDSDGVCNFVRLAPNGVLNFAATGSRALYLRANASGYANLVVV